MTVLDGDQIHGIKFYLTSHSVLSTYVQSKEVKLIKEKKENLWAATI